MILTPTEEQQAVIGAELCSQCVIACAGSGKTFTAVRRMLEIRRRLGNARGYVGLLSYSNIAVDTFHREYAAMAKQTVGISSRVVIATVDAFIASCIILPHAARVMGCARQPFLVRGDEPFLNGHKIFNGTFPVAIDKLRVTLDECGNLHYALRSFNGPATSIDSHLAETSIRTLGKVGAYTHELARYWALRTLWREPELLSVLGRRYPHLLIDEAQDVGSMHGGLLTMLQESGSCVSLIGDPNQAIFEFADADGAFLRGFKSKASAHSLSENRRSVEAIVTVANGLSGANSRAIRENPSRKHGAYVSSYGPTGLEQVIQSFVSALKENQYAGGEAVILCRGRALADRLSGGNDLVGQGVTENCACAAICRDRQRDVLKAFEFLVDGTLRLLKAPPPTLRRDVLGRSQNATAKSVRRQLWRFVRDGKTGLPPANLPAKSQWLPALKSRMAVLLRNLEDTCALETSTTWKNNLTIANLGDGPLWQGDHVDAATIRVRTVHQVKGEGVGAVLYMARKSDVTHLLAGPISEEGRIGYVALTRARDLLLLAVPASIGQGAMNQLQERGFAKWV